MKAKWKGLLLLVSIGLGFKPVGAQQRQQINGEDYVSRLHMGLGFGMDYGGIGLRAEYLPVKYCGVFAGIGYNFQGLGVNGGIALRPLPDARIQPLVMAMYGYNGVINVSGSSQSLGYAGLKGVNKTYYGLSVGFGGELKVGKRDNRLFAAVWRPFRSQEFEDNYDRMKASPYVTQKNELLPVTFSLGFNWAL